MKKLFTLACMLLPIAGVSMAQVRFDSLSKTSQNYKKSKAASPASKVSLNPQPLPPKQAKVGTTSAASKVSLNPQPLPPKQAKVGTTSAASKVSLNPQPLPPKQAKVGTTSAASKVSLNPQPLPPKQAKVGTTSAASKVSLNPQPLPPKQAKVGTTSAASKVSLNPQPLPPKQGNASVSQKAFTGNKAGKKIMIPGNPSGSGKQEVRNKKAAIRGRFSFEIVRPAGRRSLFRRRDEFFGQLRSLAKEILLHLLDKKLLRLGLPGLEPIFIEQHLGVLGPHLPRFGAYVFIDLLPQFGVERGFIQAGKFASKLCTFDHSGHGDIVTRGRESCFLLHALSD